MKTVRVDVADPCAVNTTLDGLRDTVGPAGDAEPPRVTVPVKPDRLVTVTVAVPEAPASTVRIA